MTASRAGTIVEGMIRLPLAAALAAAALLVSPAAAGAAPLAKALQRVVDAGAPGAVAYAGGRSAAAGVADLRTGRPLRAGDRIRIGSITKSFTAAVALQLVAEGRLRLGDTVEDRLPGALPYGRRVTLRRLLDHTSGVPDDVATPLAGVLRGDPRRVWTPGQLLGLVRERPPRFAPGTGWAYSNTDALLAGMMIERVTGHSLRDEIERRIVRPLRLRDTSFPVRATGLGGRAAHGYSLDLGADGRPVAGGLRDVTAYSPSFARASGNGVSSVRDVARFYGALLGGRLLRPRELRRALTTVPAGRPGRRAGLGLELRRTPHGMLAGHDGDILGFSVRALSSRDGRRQAVVAVNVMFAPPAVEEAFDAAMDAALDTAFAKARR
jgi:D-alanyl-D-alanine carboxypeptidase